MIPSEPVLDSARPEMLAMLFDRRTCGILSVKNGRTENSWRTLIWPLAMTSPMLFHALCAMTAFHNAKFMPSLKINGMAHRQKSLSHFRLGIGNVEVDVALATTLALAIAESWDDQHVSTGIQHLWGVKVFVNRAVALQQHSRIEGDNLA